MTKIVLGFVGDLAAGKGAACAYLKEKYNVDAYRFSMPLRDVLRRIYIPVSRGNQQLLSKVLRENFGQDLLSHVIYEDINNDPNEIAAADGIRRPSDIEHLKDLPGFRLVYITADSKLRHERLVKRAENEGDNTKTYEQFLTDEQAEADMQIKALGQTSNYIIENNGSWEEFYQKIEDILTTIKNEVQG